MVTEIMRNKERFVHIFLDNQMLNGFSSILERLIFIKGFSFHKIN